MIKDGARLDTIDILKYARATYPDASAVNVQGTFPMTDPYGNTATHVAIDLTYSRETLNKINFDGVTKTSIWDIRDSGSVLPAFRALADEVRGCCARRMCARDCAHRVFRFPAMVAAAQAG